MGKTSNKKQVTSKNLGRTLPLRGNKLDDITRPLIAIILVGIIALLGLLQVRKNQITQRDGQRKSDLVMVSQTIDQYYKENKKYPQTVDLPKDPHKQLYYAYKTSEDGSKYYLFARLENSKDPEATITVEDCGARCNYVITSK